ncbi:MAG: hypothetical protein ACLR5S_12290 [Ruminococcus sp.]
MGTVPESVLRKLHSSVWIPFSATIRAMQEEGRPFGWVISV